MKKSTEQGRIEKMTVQFDEEKEEEQYQGMKILILFIDTREKYIQE